MQARSLCVVLTHNHLPPPRKKLRIERCPLLPFTAHVLTDRPPPTAPGSNFGAMLQNYFRSGWAFLIPYLAAYLLYAWLKWPVNPVAAGSSTVGGGQWMVVPCLLHVYWTLHAINLVLGGLALRSWWKGSILNLQLPTSTGAHSAHLLSTVYSLLPWLLLALLFYIPGVYLEWPTDPWEHLRRINEWRALDIVTAHSSWMKSSYFIPYSLLSWCMGLRQIFWLDFYYTGICLLLCWQYYRLARACDLGERASMMFVLLQALLFGNNIFSFYRYYGISSSIYAQLGAVALTRIALEAAKKPQLSLRSFFRLPPFISQLTVQRLPSTVYCPQPIANPPTVYHLLLTGIPLLALTAYNHVQGICIAALGIMAVVVWRLVEWKRAMVGWLAFAAIGLSVAAILWYPRHLALDEFYRPGRWLTAWYGFNLFSHTSPAFDRATIIIGLHGLLNLLAGLFLLRRNHVVAWLTLTPAIALSLPIVAIPFSNALASQSTNDIITFHRMFFSIPVALAAVFSSCKLLNFTNATLARVWTHCACTTTNRQSTFNSLIAAMSALLFVALVTFEPYIQTRTWHTFEKVPLDLQLHHYEQVIRLLANQTHPKRSAKIMTTPLALSFLEGTSGVGRRENFRPLGSFWSDVRGYAQRLPSSELMISPPDFLKIGQHFPGILSSNDFIGLNILGDRDHELDLEKNDAAPVSSPWIALGGIPLKNLDGTTNRGGGYIVESPAGKACYVFTKDMLPVDYTRAYRLTMRIRQTMGDPATVYLLIAWYDKDGGFLESNSAGAGKPGGWTNGTYSYFGLVNERSPHEWTEYEAYFGWAQNRTVPPNAVFVRFGALLNYNTKPDAILQLGAAGFSEISRPALDIYVPRATTAFSVASQAAFLSGHWLPQTIAITESGIQDLQARARVWRAMRTMDEGKIPP